MRGDERGELLLLMALLLAGTALAGATMAAVTSVAIARSTAETAADAAALAAGQRLAEVVSGTDAPVWDCRGADDEPLRATAAAAAAANGAVVEELSRDGCDVAVRVSAAGGLPGLPGAPGGLPGRSASRSAGRSAGRSPGAAPVTASARARLIPGARPGTRRAAGSAPGALLAVPAAPLRRGTLLEAMVAEADRIDRLRLPYVWGGGHQSSPAPPDGPFDCSGAVSRLLQAVGYPIPTLVSGDFTRIGAPGPGRVTIWAYDGHVFMTIDGRGWGTGSPPNAGAGWLPYARPYHSRFVARHLPELEGDTVVDLTDLDLGTVVAGDPGGPPRVVLAPSGR